MAVIDVDSAARQKWSLTQEAFDSLLTALGDDRDLAAERYLEVRRNLVRLFEWRGSTTPDEWADETMNRCARKLAEGETIRDLGTYAVGVARMLLREIGRERGRESRPLDQVPEPRVPPVELAGDAEGRLECLKSCLSQIPSENRDLILHYYQGDRGEKIKNRRGLSQLLRIPANTLRMRALRVRETLQLCSEKCLQRRERNSL